MKKQKLNFILPLLAMNKMTKKGLKQFRQDNRTLLLNDSGRTEEYAYVDLRHVELLPSATKCAETGFATIETMIRGESARRV